MLEYKDVTGVLAEQQKKILKNYLRMIAWGKFPRLGYRLAVYEPVVFIDPQSNKKFYDLPMEILAPGIQPREGLKCRIYLDARPAL